MLPLEVVSMPKVCTLAPIPCHCTEVRMIPKMTNVFDRTRLVFIKSFRSKTRLCKREVFTANFLITKLQRDNDIS